MFSWLSRGLVSIADLAKWRFDNDESQVSELMQQTPGSMRALLSLESIPEVGDDDEKKLVMDAKNTLLPGGGKEVKYTYDFYVYLYIYICIHIFNDGLFTQHIQIKACIYIYMFKLSCNHVNVAR